jgi:hypothetical protein
VKYRKSALRAIAERAAVPATCTIHNLTHEPQGGGKTMGCPTCVALSREIARRARAYNRKWAPYKYGSRGPYNNSGVSR